MAVTAILLSAAVACTTDKAARACPGQYNPSRIKTSQLKRENIGRIPERGATTREFVEQTIVQRRTWIEKNYSGVVDIAVDDGWGVTYTRNQYGDITFHRTPDFLILTTVETRKDCPDPERGTLLIFGKKGLRVPVRFAYQSA